MLQHTENIKKTLIQLGNYLSTAPENEEIQKIINQAFQKNAWFTKHYVQKALSSIASMLNEQDISHWTKNMQPAPTPKKVGLILAGNIPMVGLHDILCVIASGNKALIKLSSQDNILIPFILNKITNINPQLHPYFEFVERLKNFDAVIATGSNNSSRYFEYYFKNVPHLIRKNRNSIAILNGKETTADLHQLGNDIFDYFGLGCRNVAKVYVPVNYDFMPLLNQLTTFTKVAAHHKYLNNYDYNKSIYLINNISHLDNGFLLLKKDHSLYSPLAVLYYEEYENEPTLTLQLNSQKETIQCIASQHYQNTHFNVVNLGHTQQPKLWDYADGVNTIDFLYSNLLPLETHL